MIHQLRRLISAGPTLLRVGWAGIVAYRAEMVIWILTATLPLVMLALWNAAAANGPIGAYGQVEFARYFTINLIVRQLTGCWVMWELNYLIRTGGLSSWLLRPCWLPACSVLPVGCCCLRCAAMLPRWWRKPARR